MENFSLQPVLHDWCNKGYHVCGMMHIKQPLLLIRKSSRPCGDIRFPLSLSRQDKTRQFYSHKTRENINKIDSQSYFCSGS